MFIDFVQIPFYHPVIIKNPIEFPRLFLYVCSYYLFIRDYN